MAEKEYIEREAILNELSPSADNDIHDDYSAGWSDGIAAAIDIVKKAPAAYVAPVKRARWVWESNYRDYDGDICSTYSCSNCEKMTSDESPYCPRCGAKMDGGEDNG